MAKIAKTGGLVGLRGVDNGAGGGRGRLGQCQVDENITVESKQRSPA